MNRNTLLMLLSLALMATCHNAFSMFFVPTPYIGQLQAKQVEELRVQQQQQQQADALRVAAEAQAQRQAAEAEARRVQQQQVEAQRQADEAEAQRVQQAKYFGIPHKTKQLASGTKSVFIGEKGKTQQIAAISATAVIATALAYAAAKKLGFFLTNKEQLAKLQTKLAQAIKAKERVKANSAEAKVLNAKIATIKKDIVILQAKINTNQQKA